MNGKVYNKDLDRHVPVGPNGESVVALVDRLGSSTWALSEQSLAATALTLTQAAETDKTHSVQGFDVAIGGADTTVSITVVLRAGATVLWRTRFGPSAKQGERVGVMFSEPLQAPVNTAVSLEVSAGSLGVVTDCNLAGLTR
jgi:hypothetical protein